MPLYTVPGAPADGIIKSIQRGTATGNSSGWSINISTINPGKSFVILLGGLSLPGSSTPNAFDPYVTALTSTQIQGVGAAAYNYGNWYGVAFSWQVIEFY